MSSYDSRAVSYGRQKGMREWGFLWLFRSPIQQAISSVVECTSDNCIIVLGFYNLLTTHIPILPTYSCFILVKRKEKRLEISKTSNAVTPIVWDDIVSLIMLYI